MKYGSRPTSPSEIPDRKSSKTARVSGDRHRTSFRPRAEGGRVQRPRRLPQCGCCSERDVVVEVVDRRAPASGHRGGGGARLVGEALVVTGFHRWPAGAAGAVKHRQLATEALQHDLSRVALLAGIV